MGRVDSGEREKRRRGAVIAPRVFSSPDSGCQEKRRRAEWEEEEKNLVPK